MNPLRFLRTSVAAALLIVAISGAYPLPARATLGEDEASAQADSAQLRGRRARRVEAGYAVHDIELESGTVVREYVSPGGKIFAVAWRGPTLPDLAQVMGEAHYQTFRQAPATHHVLRRLRAVQRDDLVVHSAGRPRAFSGYAYVPALLPPGFLTESLRTEP